MNNNKYRIWWGLLILASILVFSNCALQLDIKMSLTARCFASFTISSELWQLSLKHVGPVPKCLVPFHILFVALLYFGDICADAHWDFGVYIPGILTTFLQVKHFIKTVSPIVVLLFFTFSINLVEWLQTSMTELRKSITNGVLIGKIYLNENVVAWWYLSTTEESIL